MAKRFAAAALASASGLLLAWPVMIGTSMVLERAGVENAQDSSHIALAAAFSFGLCMLAWLVVALTTLVAVLRGARADTPWLWAWAGLVALGAFIAAGVIASGAWEVRVDFAQDSVWYAAVAVWTAAAGVVACMLLPWGRRRASPARTA